MKHLLYTLAIIALTLSFNSCKEEDLDSESIFKESIAKKENKFDEWLKENYVDMYNINVMYRLEDMESSLTHTLAPADFENSQSLCKIVKHAWLEAYDEVGGVDFTRKYIPKQILLVGTPAYEDNGTMILGTAEGGLKVTLYVVNYLNMDPEFLNEYYFKTMHHEFTHILNQTKPYDVEFDRISEANYIAGDWYTRDDEEALKLGLITPYAGYSGREDYAEMLSMFVTQTPEQWQDRMDIAGEEGAAIINQKLDMIKKYMQDSWGIDLVELRDVVQRRVEEVIDGTLDISPVVTLE